MDIPYPFNDYKIKHQETRHIDLTVEQTRQLATYPLTEAHICKYRDIFMLMLYLRGINAADLFTAKKTQIIDGRLEYYRRKTGAFTSVKIEPEAKAIIDKYSGQIYLIDIAEKWQDPKNYLRAMDKGLKKIGPVTYGKQGRKTYEGLFTRISSNSARHTWGSLIYDLGYSIDTASEGLTHKYGSRTTNIYVHKRQRKMVDMANRELIDYIGRKGEFTQNAN
jgi:integrase